jgi:hypothetical protein
MIMAIKKHNNKEEHKNHDDQQEHLVPTNFGKWNYFTPIIIDFQALN